MEINLDLEHLHYWMCAIRESKDPIRTLDAFWRGQISSKEWLIEELYKHRSYVVEWPRIEIYGGWVGTLASLMFQSNMYIDKITSIDIDPECEATANKMNQMELQVGRFKAVTADMCDYPSSADIVINTSFEHISQRDYEKWLSNIPDGSLIVLQTNNYNIPEHVRIAENLEQFKSQANLKQIFYQGELELPLYKRFMIIGRQ